MGFWKKLFGGSNQPDKDESVGVDPTTDEKMKPKQQKADISQSEGAKYSGREEDTKAQRQADPETREIVKDAENYPSEAKTTSGGDSKTQPRGDVDASQAVGKTKPKKSKAEQRKTQPKPGSKQKTTPKEAAPGSGKTKAGQHKEKD